MSEGVKSSLVLGQSGKKEKEAVAGEVEYKQVSNKEDFIGELSDEEKEAEFNRQHEEHIKMKLNRKKELVRIKREEFGTSSSEENDRSSDEEEIG
jgi:putative IMPACT (imprinted ancient) family translation regulator